MAQQVDGAAMPLDTEKVGIKGYLAFFSHHYFSFPAYFPEAKAGGAFLILPYSTGHSVM
ncbi:Nucleoside transporter membrane [Salmonella sp. NCTC 11881]|nr:Nucleoside transporter membrane [Salmonella sp. NCTC 11881]